MSGPRGRRGGEPTMVPPAEPRSYYGQPVINPPVWKKQIPWYLFTGGLAGASLPLSLAASLQGNDALARRAALGAFGGAVVSPALLISDLGRPDRFLYMLRVFKVTSPMSVGSWILSGFGATSTLGAARELLGLTPRAGRAAQVAGSVLGAGMATYTAALIANTAVPAWHEARRELPFVFGASAVASAGAFAAALTPVRHAGPARAMAIAGGVTEVALTQLMERRLGFVGEPYRTQTPHRLALAAKTLTGVGAVLMARTGRRRRSVAVAAGLALMAGATAERWAIFQAGMVSAEDPKYTVRPQRERLDRRG